MSSKIIGADSDYFANIVVDAVTAVRSERNGKAVYPVGAINILKSHGKSMHESELVDGFALNCTRSAQGMPRFVKDAKIALLDFDLRRHRMQMGVQVLIKNPRELEAVQQREADITKEKIQKLISAGANVILTTKVRPPPPPRRRPRPYSPPALHPRASTTSASSTSWRPASSACAGSRRRTFAASHAPLAARSWSRSPTLRARRALTPPRLARRARCGGGGAALCCARSLTLPHSLLPRAAC